MSKIYKLSIFISFFLISLFTGMFAYADGSKELYPSGKEGVRAWLRSSNASDASWPFANEGTHYVYAKIGETITLASSAQGSGNARIELYSPNGTRIVNETSAGRITNRAAELAGPQMTTSNTGQSRYVPIYHSVAVEGIYRVQFMARGGGPPNTTVLANSTWTQGSNAGIAAWDVSVVNTTKTEFIIGRVYTNILNLSNGTSSPNANGFYGMVHVLTKDGYIYEVNNNGNNGMYFTFFVNNNGFVDENTQEPIYKSLPQSTTPYLNGKVQNPNNADTDKHITHKLFYTMPSVDLPVSANGAVPGGNTWLRSAPISPEVIGVKIVGVDGTPGQVSNKGGFIQFEASTQGRYTIEIESTSSPAAFVKRTIIGTSIAGINNIPWDGKGGDGNTLPAGLVPATVTVRLQGAEVHFPFFDMEYNTKGTIIQLLDHTNLNNVKSDIVYWNDTDISNVNNGSNPNPKNNSHLAPTSSQGISSGGHGGATPVNGHIWGVNATGTSGQFGDNKSIDTWTFIQGEAITVNTDVVVKIADLKVSSITPDTPIVKIGDDILYTVIVGNDGPSDVEEAPFAFNAPTGFEITDVSYTSSCAKTEHDGVISGNTYASKLDLDNGCTVTYEFTVRPLPGATFGSIVVDATIMRPNDVTDPDATNDIIPNKPPTDPYYEIEHNGFNGVSNNRQENAVVTLVDKLTATKSIEGVPATVKTGQEITYLITIKNASNVARTPVTASDILPAGLVGATDISHSGTFDNTTRAISWSNLTVAANGELVLSFKTTVVSADDLAGIVAIKNIASIIDPTDPTEPLVPEIEVPTEGEIATSKSIVGNPASVKSGDVLEYNITIKNSFGTEKTGVTASDVLSAELINPVDLTEGGIYTAATNTINWSSLTIPANGALVLGFKVTVADNLPVGTTAIKNTAIVTDPTDPDPKEPEVEVPVPSISLVKTAVFNDENGDGYAQEGETITYTFEVTNTGGTVVEDIIINDDKFEIIGLSIDPGTLTIGEKGLVTYSYVIKQSDVDVGKIINTAIAIGQTPEGENVEDTSGTNTDNDTPTETIIPQNGDIALVKTAVYNGDASQAKVGDIITYTFTVTNTGNLEVKDLVINDAKLGIADLAVVPAILAPGAVGSVSVDYEITQADITSGTVINTAIATGTDSNDEDVEDESGTNTDNDTPTETIIPQNGDIALVKTAVYNGDASQAKVGDIITYTFTVTNTGNLEVKDLVINDSKLDLINLPVAPAILAPGAVGSVGVDYEITQADITSGTVVNTAIAVGTDSNDEDVEDESGTNTDNDTPTETIIPQSGEIALVKTAVYNGDARQATVGDIITYTFTVINTGNLEVKDLVINDSKLDLINLAVAPAILAPGAVGSVSVDYEITQADITSGSVINTAIAAGTDSNDEDVEDESGTNTDNDTPTETIIPQSGDIALVKTAVYNGDASQAKVGDKITYTFTVTNTGNLEVKDLVINDSKLDLINLAVAPAVLAPGAVGSVSVDYEITQADISSGKVINTAIATGTDSNDEDVEDESGTGTDNDTPTETIIPQSGDIALVKTAVYNGDASQAKVGDIITYTFTVTNTGNLEVKDLVINDSKLDLINLAVVPAILAPGETGSVNVDYEITQADISSGKVINTAIATGTDSNDDDVEDESGTNTDNDTPTETIIPQSGDIALVKTAVYNGDASQAKVGDIITYTFTVTNTGNLEVKDLMINDAKLGIADLPVVPAVLAPGAVGSVSVDYEITQADISSGTVINTAIAVGTDSNDEDVEDESGTGTDNDTPTETDLPQNGEIALVKTAVYNGDASQAKVGDIITYTFTVTNTGNLEVKDLVINDAKLGIADLAVVPAILAPGAVGSISVDYEITQADITSGSVINTAIAAGTDSNDDDVQDKSGTNTDNDTPTETIIPQNGDIALVKTAVYNGDASQAKVEDIITYTFTVTNTGNLEVKDLVINDAKLGIADLAVVPAILAPGETGSVSVDYKITQGDIDSGTVINTAIAKGLDSNDDDVEDISGTGMDNNTPTEIDIDQDGAITVTKSTDRSKTYSKVGNVIEYTIVVKNTGNVTLTDVVITDDNADNRNVGTIATLEVGQSETFTAQHRVTQGDLDAGVVYNIATATGKDPKDKDVTGKSTDNNPLDPTDPGNPRPDPDCTDCTIVPIDQDGAITVTKTTDRSKTYSQLGNVIEYTIVVENTGNVTLTGVVITDDNADNRNVGTIATLEVGQSETFTAQHTVIQGDLDAGVVYNIATATGKDPKDKDVTGKSTDNNPLDPTDPGNPRPDPDCTDCTIVPIDQDGAITVTKSTDRSKTYNQLGDVIEYTIVVRNTGNVSLMNVLVTDENADNKNVGTVETLAVNEEKTLNAQHTVTQSDLDAGVVYNIATATGKDPKDKDVTGKSTDNNPLDPTDPENPRPDPGCADCTITPIDQEGRLKLTKTTKEGVYNAQGQAIEYELVLTNTGNVTLRNIIITDENADKGSITPATISELKVGEKVNVTAKHTITQNDLDVGYVYNIAVATGKDPKGKDVETRSTDEKPVDPETPVDPSCPDCTITPVDPPAGIALVKTIINKGSGTNGLFVLGDEIEYSFTITNTGSKTLTDIVLNDPLLNKEPLLVFGTLAPDESITHKELYKITALDVQAGKVTNSAIVKGKDPQNKEVEDQSGSDTSNDNPTVTVIGEGPKAFDDGAETLQNTPVVIGVLGNDKKGSADLDLGSISITQQPDHGSLTLHPDGTVTYTPEVGYVGEDVFAYTVKDKNGMVSNEANVKVTVNATEPVATDDRAETEFNKEVIIPVLSNDKGNGAELDHGSVVIKEQPRNGTVRVNADGTVSYRPNPGYTGDDHFTYTVKDANGNETNVAHVDIEVTGFFIPNVFTPNGDGNNDVFEIVGLEQYDVAEVTIFNRWGNEVYRNKNYKNNWDGNSLNEGTYYYLITLKKDGNESVYKGWVLLKR